jgi:small subunit ribosomal protein S11
MPEIEESVQTKPAESVSEEADQPKTTLPAHKRRKKTKRNVASGQVHVLATFNNTIVSITDPKGNALTISSSGACGFRGSKKGTAYAAQVAAERAVQTAKQQYGLSRVEVFVRGIGLGRDAAIRVLASLDVAIDNISDVTGVPHGGVRPPKARRI